jgi:hypothetical protein
METTAGTLAFTRAGAIPKNASKVDVFAVSQALRIIKRTHI